MKILLNLDIFLLYYFIILKIVIRYLLFILLSHKKTSNYDPL